MNDLDPSTRAALEHLLAIAQCGTGQSRRCADFLLSWWKPEKYGFALADVWGLNDDLRQACVQVFTWIAANHTYPDSLGYGVQFEQLAQAWRAKA